MPTPNELRAQRAGHIGEHVHRPGFGCTMKKNPIDCRDSSDHKKVERDFPDEK